MACGKISIIIPVFNEQQVLPSLLEDLDRLTGDHEIIFVDGGSTDRTVELIESSYPVLRAPQPGRARQMNYGAAAAQGEVLFFLHADSRFGPDLLRQIDTVLSRGYRAGCFRIRFDSSSFLMKICGVMSNLRVSLRSIAFGDQGIFICRDFFAELGGFCNIPLMEDYQLSLDIRGSGERIGLARSSLLTSERRFLQNGRLRTMWQMQKLQHRFRQGAPIEEIAASYRRRDGKGL